MTLPSSGAISLAAIAGEFGGSAPHSISEYYGVASGVPSSGAISFSNFYGKSSAIFSTTITGGSAYDYQTGYFSSGYSQGFGSISPQYFTPLSTNILAFYSYSLSGGSPTLVFILSGTQTNTGWNTVSFGGNSFARTSAGFVTYSGQTTWSWSNAATVPGTGTTLVSWS